jgi:hypothetical protein
MGRVFTGCTGVSSLYRPTSAEASTAVASRGVGSGGGAGVGSCLGSLCRFLAVEIIGGASSESSELSSSESA